MWVSGATLPSNLTTVDTEVIAPDILDNHRSQITRVSMSGNAQIAVSMNGAPSDMIDEMPRDLKPEILRGLCGGVRGIRFHHVATSMLRL